MCLTAPVHVLSVEDGMATVEVAGVRRLATTLALPEVRAGDWALMSAGTLVRILDPAQAAELEAAFRTATGEASS